MRLEHYIRPLRHTFVQHVGGRDIVVPTAVRPASVEVPGGGGGASLGQVSQLIDSRLEADNVRDDDTYEPQGHIVFSDLPPLP